jgi:hypothetical protein
VSYYAANHMTAFDWFRFFDPNHKLTKDQIHYILYDMTGYPMYGMKIIIPQLRRAIRCYKKGIELCPCCGQSVKYHKKNCSLDNNNE